ncbi:MAG: hypothetical protein CMI54_01810 [Parcubacteria group bacterium]|nr:hypothetical protein [Parcubacteria group bacterium]|tara:strand:+ start:340 stop:609 length:270 start_codon:yes stop_codon:yes gene_type:complete
MVNEKINALFMNSVGYTIEGDFTMDEIKSFIENKNDFDCVFYTEGKLTRYPKSENKEVLQLQRDMFGSEENQGHGKQHCISDLMCNAGM